VADSPVCANRGQWCTFVEDLTHNDGLAKAADWLIARPISILLLLAIGLLVRWLLHRLIDRLAHRASIGSVPAVIASSMVRQVFLESPESVERRRQRADTMASLLKSITTGVVTTVVLFMTVAQLGYNIAPLIASAGIVGVALGFGAQSLVRDFLSGIFMILEDQYGVGDLIDTGEAVGTVEEMSLRLTRLRDGSGVVWYVRNGEILRVGNHSQGWSTAIVDVAVDYHEDIPRVQSVIREVADAMAEDDDWVEKIVDDPVVAGVESVTGNAVTIRVVVKCKVNEHLGVQRELRERIKAAFDRESIRVPVPVFPPAPGGPT
jgi:moderate conductance mechanosensitive channel